MKLSISSKSANSFLTMLVGLFVVSNAHADAVMLGAAKGAIMADYLLEKCTGEKTPDEIIRRQAKMLMRQGASSDDIEKGFSQGMFQVEMSYPGNKKPPKAECNKARSMYNQMLKEI